MDRVLAAPPAELRQVLRGIALNRTPGWNFPGNFLDLSFDEVEPGRARLTLEPGPHCVDAEGRVSLAALAVLLDIGMAASMRTDVGFAARMATVSMSLQLTGAPAIGRIESRGVLEGYVEGIGGQQGLARASLHAGGALVATGTGSFIALPGPSMAALPMRRRGEAAEPPALAPGDLTEEEGAVYARAEAALAPGRGSFVERFWGLAPERHANGAACDFPNGLHVGNRVGHTQGGLTFALAAATAQESLGDEWQLVGVSAWYVSPGVGPLLRAESIVVHAGGQTAVVRTAVTAKGGKVALDATTSHARRAR
jgi:acyl-coenzyme A thioesterase PaaI-like protein